jgi:hypothetical protein
MDDQENLIADNKIKFRESMFSYVLLRRNSKGKIQYYHYKKNKTFKSLYERKIFLVEISKKQRVRSSRGLFDVADTRHRHKYRALSRA